MEPRPAHNPGLRAAAGLLLVVCAGCALARRGTEERPLLRDVELVGARHVSVQELRAAIRTQPTGWLPFAETRLLDPDLVEDDLRRIVRLYRAKGYYDAQVLGWRLARSMRGQASLGFVVAEGRATRIHELNVTGLDALSADDRGYVLADLPLGLGEVVTESGYDATKLRLRERLRQRGYAHAEVEGRAVIDPREGSARLLFDADTGDRYRLGPVTVEGNRAVTARPILVAASLVSGEVYDESALAAAEESVFDLGAFRAVSVEAGAPSGGSDRVPVTIRVREAPMQGVELGAGAGADLAGQRLRARATWRHRNLFGGLDLVEITARGGWAVVPTIADPFHDGPIWGADAHLRRPNFVRRRHVFGAGLRYEHDVEPAYDVDWGRAFAGIDRIGQTYGIGAGYGFEVYRLSNFRVAVPDRDSATHPRARTDRCLEPCRISYVEPRAWIDRRDDLLEPRHGWLAQVLFEKGGGWLGGTHEYVKASPELRGYLTPFRGAKFTAAARARMGWLFPQPGPSPSVRRFYAGGPDSHRGYALRRLSPMVTARGGGTVPIGGDYLLETSVEIRVRVSERLLGALFVDAGQVGLSRSETWDAAELAWAVGPGIRYRTPVGPVRLDAGYRVVAPERRTVDGARTVKDPPWVLHLGIGEAF